MGKFKYWDFDWRIEQNPDVKSEVLLFWLKNGAKPRWENWSSEILSKTQMGKFKVLGFWFDG